MAKLTHKEANTTAILGLMIVLLGFGVVGLFAQYRDAIVQSGQFQMFMILSVVAMALLAALFYLANKSSNVVKSTKRKKKSR